MTTRRQAVQRGKDAEIAALLFYRNINPHRVWIPTHAQWNEGGVDLWSIARWREDSKKWHAPVLHEVKLVSLTKVRRRQPRSWSAGGEDRKRSLWRCKSLALDVCGVPILTLMVERSEEGICILCPTDHDSSRHHREALVDDRCILCAGPHDESEKHKQAPFDVVEFSFVTRDWRSWEDVEPTWPLAEGRSQTG